MVEARKNNGEAAHDVLRESVDIDFIRPRGEASIKNHSIEFNLKRSVFKRDLGGGEEGFRNKREVSRVRDSARDFHQNVLGRLLDGGK